MAKLTEWAKENARVGPDGNIHLKLPIPDDLIPQDFSVLKFKYMLCDIKCPDCGGNFYKLVNDKWVCADCAKENT
jgi:hypothetical protein